MGKYKLFLLTLLMFSIALVACQHPDSKSNIDSSVGMYGTIITIDKEKKQIELDITVWAREVGNLSNEDNNDVGAVKIIEVKENTLIKYENEEKATLDDIHVNQKVKVIENEEGDIEELILQE